MGYGNKYSWQQGRYFLNLNFLFILMLVRFLDQNQIFISCQITIVDDKLWKLDRTTFEVLKSKLGQYLQGCFWFCSKFKWITNKKGIHLWQNWTNFYLVDILQFKWLDIYEKLIWESFKNLIIFLYTMLNSRTYYKSF